MENRDYLRMFNEDCTDTIECRNCPQREKCRKDIEENYDIKIPR